MLSRAQLASVAALAIEQDLWVFADEAYADFSFGAPHVSLASLPGMAERTITAYSFSKSHALAGLRVGYVVVPTEVVSGRAPRVHSLGLQRPAGDAARGGGGARVRLAMDRAGAPPLPTVARGRRRGARRDPVRFAMPDGGAYVFLDFREVLGERPLSVLLERAIARGVLLAPGAGFGTDFAQHARLCFTSEPLPRLVEGITRLAAALGTWSPDRSRPVSRPEGLRRHQASSGARWITRPSRRTSRVRDTPHGWTIASSCGRSQTTKSAGGAGDEPPRRGASEARSSEARRRDARRAEDRLARA